MPSPAASWWLVLVMAVLLLRVARLLHDRLGQQLHPALRAGVGRLADHVRMHRAHVPLRRGRREQLHPALRTAALLVAHDFRVHRARVDDRAVRDAQVELGDERTASCREARRRTPRDVPARRPTPGSRAASRSRGARRARLTTSTRARSYVRPGVRCSSVTTPGSAKSTSTTAPLRRREHDRLDELVALVAAAVAADELHPRAGQGDVEDPRVGGVRQEEAHDLARPRLERRLVLAADEEDIPEPAHRGVGRLVRAERRDLAVLDQYVVERERDLAVRRRPVARLARLDDDVPVQPELLAVVLANVRVVPVDARVRERQLVCERAADRDRRLCFVRAVVAVVEPQPVPVDGVGEVALVRDVHRDARALADPQRRAGDRAVVGEHPQGVAADPLGDRRDREVDAPAAGDGHVPGRARLVEARRLGREGRCRVVVVIVVVVIHVTLLGGQARASAREPQSGLR